MMTCGPIYIKKLSNKDMGEICQTYYNILGHLKRNYSSIQDLKTMLKII